MRVKMVVHESKAPRFVIHEDGTLRLHNWVCVPRVDVLKRKILDNGQNVPHLVYSAGKKLYKDLQQTF